MQARPVDDDVRLVSREQGASSLERVPEQVAVADDRDQRRRSPALELEVVRLDVEQQAVESLAQIDPLTGDEDADPG